MSIRTLRAITSTAASTVVNAALLGGLLFACDTVYADPVTAPFSPFGGGTPDAGLTSNRIPLTQCPEVVEENDGCSSTGATCEMGSSADSRCNSVFVCASDSRYGGYWTEQSPAHCTDACPPAAQIVDGAPCDVGDAGTGPEAEQHCTTTTATCACTTGRDGAHEHARKWVCTTVPPGCPVQRPLFGQPCFGERVCDYGSCTSKRGSRMICVDDVWQTEVGSCD